MAIIIEMGMPAVRESRRRIIIALNKQLFFRCITLRADREVALWDCSSVQVAFYMFHCVIETI